MTDPPTGPTGPDPDELASALLDDVLNPVERARAMGDPVVVQRLERLREVRAQVAEPMPPLPADQLDQLVATALAAGAPGPVVAPTRLEPARRRRRTWLPPPAAAAAVIVVIALIGIGLILSGQSGRDPGSASSAGPESASDHASVGTEASGSTTVDAAGGAADRELRLPELGSFADQKALTVVLRRLDVTTLAPAAAADPGEGTAPPTTKAATKAVDRCDTAVKATPGNELSDRLAVATAMLTGRPVFVYSNPVRSSDRTSSPVTQLSVVDAETCDVAFAVRR